MKFSELLKQMPGYIGAKGSDEETVTACEKELGIRFAPEYREYLLKIGLACFDSRELTGISKSPRLHIVEVTKEERRLNRDVPENLYVVEEIGYDGAVVWQAEDGTVYLTTATQKPRIISKSLADYINS